MSAFAVAIDTMFEDPNHGLDALFRAGGDGDGVAVRVIRRNPDRFAAFGERRFIVETFMLDVRVSEVPAIEGGDTFEIAGEVLEVRGDPSRDRDRLVWTLEAKPA